MNNSTLNLYNQYINLINHEGGVEYKFEEVIKFAENKIIGNDGLTLAEVFRTLIQMLNGNLELVKKALIHANVMAKYGMKVAKESQLNRADVLQISENKKNFINRQNFTKKTFSSISREDQLKRKAETFFING
ncbi:MAG: hypothetical protein LKM44_01260 [Wolbachia endosymbiont of Meromenopon meropis]|nr:hypothetical protein [Wolbachia endosymbiont of Meromenopon meropis]